LNLINIGDEVKVHKTGAAAGCIGDGEIVTVKSIQLMDGVVDGGGVYYSGTYQNACDETGCIQFKENEYEIIAHKNN
jgi:hypothetical protein